MPPAPPYLLSSRVRWVGVLGLLLQTELCGVVHAVSVCGGGAHPSDTATFVPAGLVIVPAGNVKHFYFEPYPAFLVPYVEDVRLPQEWLASRGCVLNGSAPVPTGFGQWM